MITAVQVADLQPGDVVELTSTTWPNGAVRGPLRHNEEYGALVLNSPCGEETYVIRNAQGDPSCADQRTLTVVSRAPRPLYINHPRTERAPGDVVAAAEPIQIVPGWLPTWVWTSNEKWVGTYTGRPIVGEMISPLRLLVDGETGQVVQ